MADRRYRFSPSRIVDTADRHVGTAQAHGVIMNRDAATKFNILVGDPVLTRLSTAAGGYADVRLQAVGIIKFFPTSSQDSDFIMNRALMAQTRGTTVSDFYLVRANGTEAGAGIFQSF